MDKDEILSRLHGLIERHDVDCAMCRRVMCDPRLLTCGHSFCFDCIDAHISSTSNHNVFNCPTCDVGMRVPLNGTSRLRKHLLLSTLIEARDILYEGTTLRCSACDHNRASSACYTCASFLCSRCVENHAHNQCDGAKHETDALRSVRLAENFTRFQQQRHSVCAKHPSHKNTLFCKYEDMAICDECGREEQHTGHFVLPVNDQIQAEIAELRKTCKQLAGNLHTGCCLGVKHIHLHVLHPVETFCCTNSTLIFQRSKWSSVKHWFY